MQKQKIILIGGGGHCKSCIDVIEQTNSYEILGILDQVQFIGQKVLNYNIIGSDADIPKFISPDVQFLITIGQIKSAQIRIKVAQILEQYAAELATVISPRAYVSASANIGKGTILMNNVVVNAATTIGLHCILNTGCIIEHDAAVGDFSHISTAATLNGNCIVGSQTFIGSHTVLSNQVKITEGVVLGAGSVVVKNITHPGTYVGNPLKRLSK